MKKKHTLILIILAAFALAVPARSWAEQGFAWQFAGWYGGGCFPVIELDARVKGRAYVTSDVAGIWRSDDRGEHWRSINKGLGDLNVPVFAIAPSDSNVLYAGTTSGLYRSRDAGANWQLCDTAGGKIFFIRTDSYRSIAVSPDDPSQLAVGTRMGEVYFSKDAGAHWKTAASGASVLGLKSAITALVWSNDGSKLYAAAEAGAAVHSPNENKWEVLKAAPKKITDLWVDGTMPERLIAAGRRSLAVSEDGGKTWRLTAEIPQGDSYRILVTRRDGKTLLWTGWVKEWRGEVVLSQDDGKSWQAVTEKMRPDIAGDPTRLWAGVESRVNSLKSDPFDANILYRTDYWGVWRSDDGGRVWKEKIKGLANVCGSDIAVDETGAVWAATMDNGLLKSSDGGKSYEPSFPRRGYRSDVNGHVWRVIPQAGGKIIATSSPWNEKINQVIISTDGGKTFTSVRDGLPERRPRKNTMWHEGFPRALAADPADPNTLYLGIDGDDNGGLYISRDGGWHWTRSAGQPGSTRVYNALAVDPKDPKRIYWGAYGKGGGVYMSEDGGNSWRLTLASMTRVFDLAVARNGDVYAAGEDSGATVFRSADRGRSWQTLKRFAGGGSAEALCLFGDDQRMVAVSQVDWNGRSGGRIWLSRDAGKSWADITGDLPAGAGAAAMVYNPKDASLYVNRYAGTVYKQALKEQG